MTPAETERAKIVAWLRERSDAIYDNGYHDVALAISDGADAIERGDHEGIEI